MLLFERVSKWYGPVIGVNQVTLELRPGITGLVGANGAGKSTLLRLATGQLRPDLGSVAGARPRRLERARPSGTSATAPSSTPSTRRCPAGSSSRRWPGCAATRAARPGGRTEATLELVGMADRADRRLRGYSKGMRQRIKLAQALLHDPRTAASSTSRSAASTRSAGASRSTLFRELAAPRQVPARLQPRAGRTGEADRPRRHHGRTAGSPRSARWRRSATCSTTTRCRSASPATRTARLAGRAAGPGGRGRRRPAATARRWWCGPATRAASSSTSTGLVLEERFEVRHLETLDDSTHAVLGYLLGGVAA